MLRPIALRHMLETIERARARQGLAIRPQQRMQLAGQNPKHRVLAQFAVIVELLVARRQAENVGDADTQVSKLPTDGGGVILSLEAGYPIALPALGPRFVLEPQAQILWQHIGFNQAFDGTEEIGLGNTSGATARLGIRGQWTIPGVNGQVWQPYGRVNFWRAWGDNAVTQFGGSPDLVPLVEQTTWGEAVAGVTFGHTQQLSSYAQFGYQFALTSNSGIRGFLGDIGLRYTW